MTTHALLYFGDLQCNHGRLQDPTNFRRQNKDGSLSEDIIKPSKKINGMVFAYMQRGSDYFIVSAGKVVLYHPLPIDLERHTPNGTMGGPAGLHLDDKSAQHIVQDSIELNPHQRVELLEVQKKSQPKAKSKTEEYAYQVLPYLVYAAQNRQLLTYGELAQKVGRHHRPLSGVLAFIRDQLCAPNKGVPMITAIVINQDTKLPGESFLPEGTHDLSEAEYRQAFLKHAQSIFNYDKWDQFLAELNLSPISKTQFTSLSTQDVTPAKPDIEIENQNLKDYIDQLEKENLQLRQLLETKSSWIDTIQDKQLKKRLKLLQFAPLDTIIRESGVVLEHRMRTVSQSSSAFGVRLVDALLDPDKGTLAFSKHGGEQSGVHMLYRGAMQFIRNPPMHKLIEYHENTAQLMVRLIDSLLMLLEEGEQKP